MEFDDRRNMAFLRAEAAYLAPPEPKECECDDDDMCDMCIMAQYDEDDLKDPDRARDERIDMALERDGDCND